MISIDNTYYIEEYKQTSTGGNGVSEPISAFEDLEEFIDSLHKFLYTKNKRYGNSVLEPLSIFSKHTNNNQDQALNNILIRLDDKLSRIRNADKLRENDVADLLGYLVFLGIKLEIDFDRLVD